MKSFAAHYIKTLSEDYLRQFVIQIDDDGVVSRFFPLEYEIESVEWLPGIIEIVSEDNCQVAYHLFPYDFICMQPVCETQRRRLL